MRLALSRAGPQALAELQVALAPGAESREEMTDEVAQAMAGRQADALALAMLTLRAQGDQGQVDQTLAQAFGRVGSTVCVCGRVCRL